MSTARPLAEGEPVLLRRRGSPSVIVPLRHGIQAIDSRGSIDLTPLVGAPPGTPVTWAGVAYRAFRPSLADRLGHLRRRAQIVTPKDATTVAYLAGASAGASVVEVGAGSGALTVVLAAAVGESGRVRSIDRRPDFLEVARNNVEAAGYAARVSFRLGDPAAEGFVPDDGPADGAVLDVPAPWELLPGLRSLLVPGGSLAVYTPTYNQLERTVRELRALAYEEVRSLELLERALHIGEGGTRPEFDMLGHTGFLTGARWFGSE